MRLVVNFFLIILVYSFFVYSAGAGASACGLAFEQAAVDIAKKQSLEEFLQGLGEAVKNEQVAREEARIAKAGRMISDSLQSMTPEQKTRFNIVKEYIKQLVSWGFSREEAFEIAVKNEPFRSLNSRKFGEIRRLVDLGLSGKEAFKTVMLIDSKYLSRVAGNEKLTPEERQQKILAVTQYVEWMVSLGLSGKEVVREMKYNNLLDFMSNAKKLTPRQERQFEAVKQHIEWLMSLGFSVKEALEKSTNSLQTFSFTESRTSAKQQKIKETMDLWVERFGISEKTARDLMDTLPPHMVAQVFDKLSNSGFGDSMIGKIAKVGIFHKHSVASWFGWESMSVKQKRDKLRQVGFTEAEIQRIPVNGVMRMPLGERTFMLFFGTTLNVVVYGGLYGIYWWFSG